MRLRMRRLRGKSNVLLSYLLRTLILQAGLAGATEREAVSGCIEAFCRLP